MKQLEIKSVTLAKWEKRPETNNFFEIVYIEKGEGFQCIDYNHFSYQKGNIFLLPPLKCHSFTITEETTFIFLKLLPLFSKNISLQENNNWFQEASTILSSYNQKPGDLIQNPKDKEHLITLIYMILAEEKNYNASSLSLIEHLMSSILHILMRNIRPLAQSHYSNEQDEKIIKIIDFINRNIRKPQLLKANFLAKKFFVSPAYISQFFKKNAGISLSNYILQTRLKQVEVRLINSDFTVGEIANEFGFTDSSHLSKTFKKYAGTSIREFKQKRTYILLKKPISFQESISCS